MTTHRYIFEKYNGPSSKHTCPKCRKTKVFTRYIDTETGSVVHPSVGRCDRESNCGNHYGPKEYFQDNKISIDTNISGQIKRLEQPPRPTSYITTDIMEASLRGYKQNNFARFIANFFGEVVTADVLKKYFVGTSKHWPGSTVFWQVDKGGKIRSGKIILYNVETGKRVKEPFSHITWVHSALKQPEFELKQCLFGEHLLKASILPVAIAESEKTAIIASIYLPQFTWLATGGLSNLTSEKFFVLKGRTVVLFPDVKGFDKWAVRAKELSNFIPGTRFEVSDLLEKNATEHEKEVGCDIADYLIRFKWIPQTQQEKTLQLLMEKNPSLSKLIDQFDLAIDEYKDNNYNPKSRL